MEFLNKVTEDHMVAAFVRAEIDSARFSNPYRQLLAQLRVGRGGLIDRPDLSNEAANKRRRFLLRMVRGYQANQFLFRGWPDGVEWWRVNVPLDELKSFKYAHYQTWIDFTKGSRLVADGAANVDTVPAGEDTNANIKVVAALAKSGREFAEIILLAQQKTGPVVVMEGHTRATAYVIARRPNPVTCLLGLSSLMNEWFYWGTP